MRISTSLNVLYDPAPESINRAIRRLAACGFDSLDFNFVDWCFPGSPFAGPEWTQWVDSAAECARECGVRFTQAHGPIFHKWDEGERTQEMIRLSHRSLQAAGRLGISWVVFEPETEQGAWDEAHLSGLLQRNLDWFAPLVATAEKEGIGIALENVSDPQARYRNISRWYGSLPGELNALADGFASPHVGLCWDTGHAQIQGVDQASALRAMGKRLKVLHIQDNDGVKDQHLAPHYGKVNWQDVMGALRAIPYEGEFTYEIHNFIRNLPDGVRDDGLKFIVAIARDLITRY